MNWIILHLEVLIHNLAIGIKDGLERVFASVARPRVTRRLVELHDKPVAQLIIVVDRRQSLQVHPQELRSSQ
jgi:hypothetical protein